MPELRIHACALRAPLVALAWGGLLRQDYHRMAQAWAPRGLA